MAATGTASVYGIDGTVTFTGAARTVDVQSATLQDNATVDEFLNGRGQLIGFNARDRRHSITIEMFPKGTTAADAITGLTLPGVVAKVTLSGFDAVDADINGDWIYVSSAGGSKAHSAGQARLTLPLFKPLDLPAGVTVTTLTTAVA
jgi:hypothetical protein